MDRRYTRLFVVRLISQNTASMIKKSKPETAKAVAQDADVAAIALCLTNAKQMDRIRLERRKEEYDREREYQRENVERSQMSIEEYTEQIELIERDIAALPAPVPVSVEEARTEAEKVLAIPFVKSMRTEKGRRGQDYIVVQTHENALFTTINRKYSKNERWYESKPYRIPLPAYNIRIGTEGGERYANSGAVLAIALADEEDTKNFIESSRYNHEPHPHWGTPGSRDNQYQAVCLGEYENEVTRAFRSTLAEGLIALAVYLQTSGTESAYISSREMWALWLGKKEYNAVLIPSSKKELEGLKEVGERGADMRFVITDTAASMSIEPGSVLRALRGLADIAHDDDNDDDDRCDDHLMCSECDTCQECDSCDCE